MLTCFSVSQCSSVGASFCYLLFYLVGRRLVQYYLPDRVAQWCEQVHLVMITLHSILPQFTLDIRLGLHYKKTLIYGRGMT